MLEAHTSLVTLGIHDGRSAPQHLGEHGGLADVRALRGGQQRQGAVPGQLAQVRNGLGTLLFF